MRKTISLLLALSSTLDMWASEGMKTDKKKIQAPIFDERAIASAVSELEALRDQDGAAAAASKPTRKKKADDSATAISVVTVDLVSKTPTVSTLEVERVEDALKEKLTDQFYKLVTTYDEQTNAAFQKVLVSFRKKAEKIVRDQLEKIGQKNLLDPKNKDLFEKRFASEWKNLINQVYKVLPESDAADLAPGDLGYFSDDEDSERGVEEETTLLNLLLRRSSKKPVEFIEKVMTLLQYGCDVNLSQYFSWSSKMKNQKEYPLRVILEEVPLEFRHKLFKLFSDESNVYTYNYMLSPSEQIKPLIYSLDGDNDDEKVLDPLEDKREESKVQTKNYDYVLDSLLESRDYLTFDLVLSYLEKEARFIIKAHNDKSSGVEDQIKSPLFDDVLTQMSDFRKKAFIVDKDRKKRDMLEAFLTHKDFKDHFSHYHNTWYDLDFQTALSGDASALVEGSRHADKVGDYDKLFDEVAAYVDRFRAANDCTGDQFKKNVIEWVKLANFAVRISEHLNRLALTKTKDTDTANVTRLIRYANRTTDKDVIRNQRDYIFNEIHHIKAHDIIFGITNDLGWDPVTFAVITKQSKDLQLIVNQLSPSIKRDGLGNNPFHLAFVLPASVQDAKDDQAIKVENSYNLADYFAPDTDDKNLNERAKECILAFLHADHIPEAEKIIALKAKNDSNYTPISMAARAGYYDCVDLMMDFMGRFYSPSDHEYLGMHLEKIIVMGIHDRKEKLKTSGRLTDEDARKFNDQMVTRATSISEQMKLAVDHPYRKGTPEDDDLLNLIQDGPKQILDRYQKLDRSQRGALPFVEMLDSAVELMLRSEKQKIAIEEEVVEEKVDDASKALPLSGIKTKSILLTDAIPLLKKVPGETGKIVKMKFKEVDHPLRGMKYSTNSVKVSFLKPVVDKILRLFLNKNEEQNMDPKAVYIAITGSKTGDYFTEKFNPVVDTEMKSFIKQRLIEAGKYKEKDVVKKERGYFEHITNMESKAHGGAGAEDEEGSSDDAADSAGVESDGE